MGCDIHAYIEITEEDGRSFPVAPNGEILRDTEPLVQWSRRVRPHAVDLNRDYILFSLMADVRTDDRMRGVEPVKKATYEMPNSEVLREEAAWLDAHSHSTMTADELEEVQRRYDEVIRRSREAEGAHPYLASWKRQLRVDHLIATLRWLGPGARLVFWFDN